MSLSLKIPALVDKPLLVAETRPAKILQFLGNLSSNPVDAGTALLEEMEILNRQKVAPDARFKALESYRPTVISLTETLSKNYSAASLPLAPIPKKHAAVAESLWLELGYGYKLALVDQQNKIFSLGSNKSTATVIQRAIDSLGQLALVYYQTYVTPPGTVWEDLHQLYAYAVEESLQDMEIQKTETQKGSVALSYKQTLLMWLADPQHLSANDIKHAADYIERFAHYTSLQSMGSLENPAAIFLVSLNVDKPPIPYGKNVRETDADNDILLITINLARLIHKHIKALGAGESAKQLGLPDHASDPRYQDMLTYLIKHWGTPPKRVFNRSRKNDGAELGIGVAAAHYFVSGEKHYSEPESFSNVTQISAHTSQKAAQQDFKSSRWQILNISAGGMALRKFPISEASIRVGEIISARTRAEDKWTIAVVRWASNHDQQLDIGTQLIAPEAKTAGARQVNQDKFEPVLLLPELPALKQAASIVAACGTYSPARVLELDQEGSISRIMVTRLIERTNSFERFLFSNL